MAKQAEVQIILKMVDRASKTMNKVSSSTKKMSKNLTSAGAAMNKVSLPLLAIGLAGVKMASDLDKSMRNIQAFGGQTEKQIKSLSQTFKDMSVNAEFGTQSAQQLADAFFNIQSAGFLGAEGMEVLEVSAKAATAGLTTTKKASEGIMTVLNAYSLTAQDATNVSDQLFTTIKLGVGTFEQLIPTLGEVVPLANAMDISFDQVSAAYVVMSKQGIAFNRAATQQKAIMTQLLSPGAALQAQMQALGFASGQAMVDSLGFLGTLDALASSVGNTSTGIQNLFVNTRAVSGVLALTGDNALKAAAALAEMQKAGAAQEAFTKNMQSFSAQFSIFKNTLGVFLIDIGEQLLPVLMKGMEAVRAIVGAFQSLPGPVKQVVGAVTLFVAIMGPVLTIGGAILGVFSTLAGVFTAVATAMGLTTAAAATTTVGVAAVGTTSAGASVGIGALAASLWAMLAPFAAVLAPIALVGAALAGLVAFGPKILEFGKNVIDGLVRGIKDPIGAVAWGIGKVFGVKMKQGTAEGVEGTAKIVADQAVQAMSFIRKASNNMNRDLDSVSDNAVRAANNVARATGQPEQGLNTSRKRRGMISLRTKRFSTFRGRTREESRRAFDAFDTGGGGGGFGGGGGGGFGGGSNINSLINTAINSADISAKGLKQIFDALGGNRIAGVAPGSLVQKIMEAVDFGRISVSEGEALRNIINQKLAGGGGAVAGTPLAGVATGVGGDVNITIEELNVPAGTPKEAVDFIWDEIGKRIKKSGVLSGRGVIT